MTMEIKHSIHASLRNHISFALGLIVFLLGGIIAWASLTQISSAVIANGSMVVDSSVKKVQHQTGGIVSEVRVRDGDRVHAGEVLVRLDETVPRASLAIVKRHLDELYAEKARLEAERDGLDSVPVAPELEEQKDDADVGRIIHGEDKLFSVRRAARDGQKAQLAERIEQLKKEIAGYEAQQLGKEREVELIGHQLDGARKLWDKQLMPVTKYTELQREAARLDGEQGVLTASIAQLKGKISETELQIIQIDRDFHTEIGKELREGDAKIGELIERRVAAEDQLKRIEIRAPQSGTVHQSNVHTVGGVISPGDTIMLIVPDEDSLKVDARVAPQDIDQLSIGQTVTLRFSGLDRPTTPEINGTLQRISPDTSADQKTGQSFYTVRVGVDPVEFARLGALKLVPGMPVEMFVKTGQRSVLSYLVKPLGDQVARTFREQ